MRQSIRELMIIKILLSKKSHCSDAYDITQLLNELGYPSTLVQTIKALSSLKRKDVIVRRWLRTNGKKIRIYCLNS